MIRCECMLLMTARGMAAHKRGEPHACAMSQVLAASRGHMVRLSPAEQDSMRRLAKAGFGSHFSCVKSHQPGGPGKRSKIRWGWRMSDAMARAMPSFFRSGLDASDSLHAALVLYAIHGDETPSVLMGVLRQELNEPLFLQHETGLIAVLKANGVESPALSLIRLLPHALAAWELADS